MLVKVCGLKDEKNINDVSNLDIDFMGLIFYKNSKRFFDKDYLVKKNNKKIVGVFVNETIDEIKRISKKYNLDYVQLHGDESPEFCKKILDSGVQVIKSFRIDDKFDFGILKNYEDYCDMFLFDSKSELPGGTGKSFNWEILKKYNLKKDFFISGGIGLHSIDSLFDLLKIDLPIYGIDVNSKFEDDNYLKKIDELNTFIETIKDEIYS